MTPRWPLFVLFAAAGAILATPAIASQFVEWSPPSVRFVNNLGIGFNFLIFGLALVDLIVSPSLRRIDIEREMSDVIG